MPTKILFVTGRLAEPALRRVLQTIDLPCPFEIATLKISVAALMTTSWIARRLSVPEGVDLIVIPGLCQGDLDAITQATGIPAQRGPDDLQDLPLLFGQSRRQAGYGAFSIRLVAEIQDALRLDDQALLSRASYYRDNGADLIDLGVTPGSTPGQLAHPVRLLKDAGFRVSVDTMDPVLLREGASAGAEMLLSLNGTTLALAREIAATPVVVPDDEGGVETLWRNAEQLWSWGLDCVLDPIIQPIGFGFARSLDDLYQTRQRYPEARLMLGAHHLTELTDADSTGINALLAGIAQELRVEFILTTEVVSWAQGSLRQLDSARRLMHYALHKGVLPKRIDDGLLTLRDQRVLRQDADELRELHAALTDPNIRIFVGAERIFAFNADVFADGTDIAEIFAALAVDEPGHAFYLGCELTKAALALQLGKTYQQDRPLRWGYLSQQSPLPARHKRVRLASRRRRE